MAFFRKLEIEVSKWSGNGAHSKKSGFRSIPRLCSEQRGVRCSEQGLNPEGYANETP